MPERVLEECSANCKIRIEGLARESRRCESRIVNILVNLSDADIGLEDSEKEMSPHAMGING